MFPGKAATIWHASYGVVGSSLATVLPVQEQIEWVTREAGALVGLLIAIFSLFNLIQHNRKGKKTDVRNTNH